MRWVHILNQSHLKWPNILPPPPIAWETWKKALSQNFCQSHNTTRLKSHMRLGAWLKPTNDLQKKWKYVYSASTSSVYITTTTPSKTYFLLQKKGIASTSYMCRKTSQMTYRLMPHPYPPHLQSLLK